MQAGESVSGPRPLGFPVRRTLSVSFALVALVEVPSSWWLKAQELKSYCSLKGQVDIRALIHNGFYIFLVLRPSNFLI